MRRQPHAYVLAAALAVALQACEEPESKQQAVESPKVLESAPVRACKLIAGLMARHTRHLDYDKVIDDRDKNIAVLSYYSPNAFGTDERHVLACAFTGREAPLAFELLMFDGEELGTKKTKWANRELGHKGF